MQIDELKECSRADWERVFAGLASKVAAAEIYVNILFPFGHLRSRLSQLQVDDTTIRASLYQQSPDEKSCGDIRLLLPEEEEGAFHVFEGSDGNTMAVAGVVLCRHLEHAEIQIATSLELFEIEDSPSQVH